MCLTCSFASSANTEGIYDLQYSATSLQGVEYTRLGFSSGELFLFFSVEKSIKYATQLFAAHRSHCSCWPIVCLDL